jgi:hypothetical protein
MALGLLEEHTASIFEVQAAPYPTRPPWASSLPQESQILKNITNVWKQIVRDLHGM